jgi:type IV pilus assembly protein PilN
MLYQNPVRLNLLPHREALVESHKKLFATRAILVAVLAAVLMLLAWQVIDRYIASQQERNTFLSTEVKKLDQEIAQIATLQQEIDALKARQKAVEDLQSDRNLPVYVFEELASYVPEGVFLKTVRQDVKKITITGLAQTQERVSEMLRNFTNASVWLEQPELLEIKLANNYGGIKTSEKLYEFTIAVLTKREKKTIPSQNSTANPAASTNSNLNTNLNANTTAISTQSVLKNNNTPASGANTAPSVSTTPATTASPTVMPMVKKP